MSKSILNIDHVDLSNHGILGDVKLSNLGKVNVICGKNGGGKTTILKAFRDQSEFINGFKLDEHKIDQLIHVALQERANNRFYIFSHNIDIFLYLQYTGGIDKVLNYIAHNNIVFFEDAAEKLADMVVKYGFDFVQVNRDSSDFTSDTYTYLTNHKNYTYVRNLIRDLFSGTIDGFINRIETRKIYINPKRIAFNTANFSIQRDVVGDGSFFIEKLFHLKSSLPDSDDRKSYEIIFSIFSEVSGNYKFDVVIDQVENKTNLNLYFSRLDSESWILAENSGLGLHDLLLIVYFALETNNPFVLIEEPENHLHPDMQRRLLQFLKFKTQDYKQFLISTHSSVFLDSRYVDCIYFSAFEDNKINLNDVTSKAKVLHNLGYSVNDNLVSDLIILVEGPTDKFILEHFITDLGLDTEYNIKIWILSGDNMIHQDLSAFKEDYKIMALTDREKGTSHQNRIAFNDLCNEYGIFSKILDMYSMESYFSVDALNEVFNKYDPNLPEITNLDTNDLRSRLGEDPIWEVLGSTDERRKELKSKLKKKTEQVFSLMSFDDIRTTDLGIFINKIKESLEEENIPSPS